MPARYRTILMFGPPGVGKGTQGKLLGCIPGFHHFATGDMFRSLDRSSEIGRKIHSFSARGELVPDELTIELWRQTLEGRIARGEYSPDGDLLVLDGIPRSVAQAAAMKDDIDVLTVIHLTAPSIDEMVKRMKRRAMREGREDDGHEDVIRRRFEVYESQSTPVLRQYDAKLIARVNAIGTPAEVLMHVLESVVPVYNEHFDNPLNDGKR
jgi:adenylate kinase